MFEQEEKNEQFGRFLESILDDLFLVKIELKLLRMDELLGEFGQISANNDYAVNLRTKFQRMYYCRQRVKRYIFWTNDDTDSIKKTVDERADSFRLEGGVDKGELMQYALDMIEERSREIEASKKWILNKKKASEYRETAFEEFKREEKSLSRMEGLNRLNRIQWRCGVLDDMETFFRHNNNLDAWKYESPNPFSMGIKDERAALDF